MRISVLGTGSVGRTLAGALAGAGHDVAVGTRDPELTMARAGDDSYAAWAVGHPAVRLLAYAEAGAHAEVLVNATNGRTSEQALAASGAGDVEGRVVVDVANAFTIADGAVVLDVPSGDSLAERLQRAFPAARVVKTLNTVNARVMVDPASVPGDHVVLVAADDDTARQVARGLLADLGWRADQVVDLAGLAGARATEGYLPLWVALVQALGTVDLNVEVRRA